MVSAISSQGPWSLEVQPYRPDEPIYERPEAEEAPYFYLCDTLPLKLRLRLPFSHFEWSVLNVLNIAPTQLYPNS
ncbi:hypothetical protein CR513_52717, partial [Mucuna pruriens]